MQQNSMFQVLLLIIWGGILLVACVGATEPVVSEVRPTAVATVETNASNDAVPEPTADNVGDKDKIEVRWFVGLGTGTSEEQLGLQEAVVANFNAAQDQIELVLEIVSADIAYEVLESQIAAGNAPDVVGPVGIHGRDVFQEAWLDLQPMIEAEAYDLSDYDPVVVDLYHDEQYGQVGLPFAIFPSFISYNADLFDDAGIPYPPAEYGAPYVTVDGAEVTWDLDALRDVALLLTIDVNGNNAVHPDFDKDNIVQFGYFEQWSDFRGDLTLFGPGSLVDDAGDAQLPDHWRDAVQWFYDGQWNDVFYPNGLYQSSNLLTGNEFESGNVAMAHTHLWYYGCCIVNVDFDYNVAPMPITSIGVPSAKIHADSFGIMKTSANPDAAWEVLKFFHGDHAPVLLEIYSGMPARRSLREAYLESFAQRIPNGENLHWQTVVDSIAYADDPNHEFRLPNFNKAQGRYNDFWFLIGQDGDLDIDAEMDRLVTDLQSIYDEVDQ